MTAAKPGPRERLINTAIAMVRERGVHATGLSDLLKRSSAARNSIYQHFPGGKEELMVAVTNTAGNVAVERIDRLAATGDPIAIVRSMIDRWATELEASDFGTGCPLAAAALAGPDEPAITAAAGRAFQDVRGRIGAALTSSGMAPVAAAQTASFALSAIEGALLQARAERSVQPLRDAEAVLTGLLTE